MTRPEALATVRCLALAVVGDEQGAGCSRLLERIAARDDAAELRACLAELGALTALRAAMVERVGADV